MNLDEAQRPAPHERLDTVETEAGVPGESDNTIPVQPDVPDVLLGSLVRFEPVTILLHSAPTVEPALVSVVQDPLEFSLQLPPAQDAERPDVALGSLAIFEQLDPIEPSDDRVRSQDPRDVEGSGFLPRKAVFLEWAESLAMVVAFILVFTGYIAQATQVPTGSMKPSILVGDHFFIEKIAFPGNYPAAVRRFLPERAVRRGDIIVFRSPIDGKIPFVKRVIGTPGDRVEIRQKDVFVNGVKLDEPYKIHVDQRVHSNDAFTSEQDRKRDNYGPEVIPPDKFFVMGDNRDDSNDSRYWGFVGRDAIMGMPLFVYWSYRADPYGGSTPTISERINDYMSTGIHFFSRTRWFRFGALVQ